MTPPLCQQCCSRPVKPARANELSAHVIDGQRWRRFCSRSCAGRTIGARNLVAAPSQQALLAWRRKALQQRLARYIEACKGVATPDGLVAIKDMVRVMADVERQAYARGWDACRDRLVKGRAA